MKPWYRQKSFWLGIGSIASGGAFIVTGQLNEGVTLIVGGFATIFLRDAIAKNTPLK
jgi:hypothetical protein